MIDHDLKSKDFFEKYFGISKGHLDKVLAEAMKRGGDFADVYLEYRRSQEISMEEGKIKNISESVTGGAGIRVLSGEKTGFASSNGYDFKKMMEAAKSASFIGSKTKSSKAKAARNVPVVNNLYPVSTYPTRADLDNKLDLVRAANSAAFAHDKRIKNVWVTLATVDKVILVANSDGICSIDHQPMTKLSVTSLAEEGKRIEEGAVRGGGRHSMDFFNDNSPEYFGKKASTKAITALSATEAPAGIMEVVLAPGETGVLLHEAVGHGLEGDMIRKKTSIFSDMIGKRVGSELVTVVDDGTIPNANGSVNIDDEGTPTERTVLIEKGILKRFLHDRLNSKLMGSRSTGNGRRQSFAHVPIPRMRNTFMLPGKSTPEEIIKSVKHGVYAVDFAGGQVDTTSGKFVFSVREAYMIRNGKLAEAIKGATFTGDCKDILNNVVMVGNDFKLSETGGTCGKDGQWVPVNDGIATVKLKEMTVGGTKVNPK